MNTDYKKKTGGCIPSKFNGTEFKFGNIVKSTKTSKDYPLTFKLWTSGIKNQVDKNSCVAHALTSLKEIQDYYDSKSKETYSTSWIYLIREMDQYKGEGMIIKEAMTNLCNTGVVPYSMMPGNVEYGDGLVLGYKYGSNEELRTEAAKHKIANYALTENALEIKRSLYENHSPVVIGAYIYESFYGTGVDGIVAIPNETKEYCYGGHAMIIIGWTLIGTKEYWIVQNSWGEQWGDNGFCYLEIDKFPLFEMWTSLDITDYPCELTDIAGRWSTEYIEKCVRAGVINGFEDKTFRPQETLTREQFCAALWNILKKM